MTPDTSAIVTALRGVTDLVARAEVEAYSVLTRLPAPFRVDPAIAAEFLRGRFPGMRIVLPAAQRRSLVGRLAAAGVAGGKTYDALTGARSPYMSASTLAFG